MHTSSLAPALSLILPLFLSLPPSLPLYPFSLVWSIVDGRCSETFRGCLGVLNGGRAVHVVDGDNLPHSLSCFPSFSVPWIVRHLGGWATCYDLLILGLHSDARRTITRCRRRRREILACPVWKRRCSSRFALRIRPERCCPLQLSR